MGKCGAVVVVLVPFGIDQMLKIVMLGKTAAQILTMLPNPACEIVGHSDVQRAVRMVRHDVYPSTRLLGHVKRGGAARGWKVGSSPTMTINRVTATDSAGP